MRLTAASSVPPPPQMMESKLLVGGKNIVDHTNEQQRMLELRRQEIAEQVGQSSAVGGRARLLPPADGRCVQKCREREMQQQMESRDEETLELKETYGTLQQEVDVKTKKLKKVAAAGRRTRLLLHPPGFTSALLLLPPPQAVCQVSGCESREPGPPGGPQQGEAGPGAEPERADP